jgi:hypothetical protein
MNTSKRKVAAVLVSTLMLLVSCEKNVITVPSGSTKPQGTARAQAFIDSTGKVSAANDAVTASGVTTIALKAGDQVTVRVMSNECSGNPETVIMYGVLSAPIASGSCAGGLVGKGATIGPASADGTIYFTATHQVYGEGPPGNVTGADPDYTVGLNDGYGDTDFNDVIISVKVSPAPRLACEGLAPSPAPVTRGETVKCTAMGAGVTVTGWNFTGPAYNPDSAVHNVSVTSTVNPWSGPAVASGTVSAKIAVNGVARTDSLRATFTVQNRAGPAWHWQKDINWHFGEGKADQNCHKELFLYMKPAILGWNVRAGTCDVDLINPFPLTSDKGFTLQLVTSGPNTGLWYVKTVTYKMDTESNFLAAVKRGSSTRWKLLERTQQAACDSAGVSTTVNFYDFNVWCKGLSQVVPAFHQGILWHEGRGKRNDSGHQAQVELEAALPRSDMYRVVEAVFAFGKDNTGKAVRFEANKVTLTLISAWASHTYVKDNWCGDLWRWDPAPSNMFLFGPIKTQQLECI